MSAVASRRGSTRSTRRSRRTETASLLSAVGRDRGGTALVSRPCPARAVTSSAGSRCRCRNLGSSPADRAGPGASKMWSSSPSTTRTSTPGSQMSLPTCGFPLRFASPGRCAASRAVGPGRVGALISTSPADPCRWRGTRPPSDRLPRPSTRRLNTCPGRRSWTPVTTPGRSVTGLRGMAVRLSARSRLVVWSRPRALGTRTSRRPPGGPRGPVRQRARRHRPCAGCDRLAAILASRRLGARGRRRGRGGVAAGTAADPRRVVRRGRVAAAVASRVRLPGCDRGVSRGTCPADDGTHSPCRGDAAGPRPGPRAVAIPQSRPAHQRL